MKLCGKSGKEQSLQCRILSTDFSLLCRVLSVLVLWVLIFNDILQDVWDGNGISSALLSVMVGKNNVV
ncbi:hypothetical protein RIF29_00724 [Crotalaria pallida]|uniref:Uncharacterized protein n=1 Tax=Crotalaria pallida TaxID=3830 RepID=A0AAN9IWH2_CROPI